MLRFTISLWITAGVTRLFDCSQYNSFNCSQRYDWYADLSENAGHNSSTIPAKNSFCCNDNIVCDDVTAVLHDIVEKVHWSNLLFIRSHNHGSVQFHRAVLNTLSDLHVGVVHVTIDEDLGQGRTAKVNLTETFQPLASAHLRVSTIYHLIVCVSPRFVRTVMEQALVLQMLTARYRWLILCPVDAEITASLARLLPQHSNVLLLQDGVSTATASNDGEQAWNMTVGLLAWVSHPVEQFTQLSSWQLGTGWMKPLPTLLFPNVFTDFGNRMLRVGTIPSKPFVIRKREGNVTTYEGFCIDLLRTIATHLNFRFVSMDVTFDLRGYVFIESPDGMYGAITENGSWNGMVGMVSRKEVDMAIGPYTITSARETVVDFSVPYIEDGGGILTKTGPGSSANWMAGLGTFSNVVWLSLIGTILGVGIVFYLVVRFSPYSDDSQERYWHLWGCVMHICGSIMMQGMERLPTNVSARCILGFWWVFSILIISMYTATLTSVLSVELEGTKIDSIDELAQSSIKPFTLSGGFWESFFKSAEEGMYKQIAGRMNDMPVVTDGDTALQNVLSGGMAFLNDVNNVRYMQAQHCKDLHLAQTIYNSNGLGLILPEKAPFKDAVNDVILRMHEGGFLEQWRTQWWPISAECESQSSGSVSDAKQLGLSKLVGLLLVYGAVVVASGLCFLFMLCLHKTGTGVRVVRGCRELCQVFDKKKNAETATVDARHEETLTSG